MSRFIRQWQEQYRKIVGNDGLVMTDAEATEFFSPRCKNCGLSELKHMRGKCLFSPTSFVLGESPPDEE